MKNEISKYATVPEVLKNTPQWLLWRSEPRQKKKAKIPFTVTGHPYRPGESRGLASFEAALARLEQGGFDGLGFAFLASDPFTGIDLDWKDQPDTPKAALALVRRFASYAEWSPSGRGAHIIVRARLPEDARHRTTIHGISVEVYDNARYFTVTGAKLPQAPAGVTDAQAAIDRMYERLLRPAANAALPATIGRAPVDDDELLKRAFAASNGNLIRRLFNGDTHGYPSPSEADAALAALLAFYTGPDPNRLERLMWRSKLARPEKWASRRGGETWIRRTVEFAIKTQRRFWRRSA